MNLENDTYLRALAGEPVEHTPVWIMRQAGRYLPEYREIRKQAGDFMTMCQNPELACEVTMQPLRRYPLDAAIIFSDILTIPDAMGLGLHFVQGEGPKFTSPVRTDEQIRKLNVPVIEETLQYVMDAISVTRKTIAGKVPLIGFSGSPWTLATYMVEGGSSKDFSIVKRMLFDAPKTAHTLLDVLARSVTEYLNAQVEAGAQALMIFDTWGGVLNPSMYREFSVRYMQQIVAGLKRTHDGRTIPVTLFTKGAGHRLVELKAAQPDAVGVDWTLDLSTARTLMGPDVGLQGNVDPCLLYASHDVIRDQVRETLGQVSGRHVFNLGHGVKPDMDPERVGTLIDAVHEYSRQSATA